MPRQARPANTWVVAYILALYTSTAIHAAAHTTGGQPSGLLAINRHQCPTHTHSYAQLTVCSPFAWLACMDVDRMPPACTVSAMRCSKASSMHHACTRSTCPNGAWHAAPQEDVPVLAASVRYPAMPDRDTPAYSQGRVKAIITQHYNSPNLTCDPHHPYHVHAFLQAGDEHAT